MKAVAFDVGETIVDETRYWNEWAEWFGIRPFVLNALLGATIASREPHGRVFHRARPDLENPHAARRESGNPDVFIESDLYSDVRPCLEALRESGFRTCIAGNQPPWMADAMRGWDLPVDFITDSAELDALKPDRRFFTRLLDRLELDASEVAYVGDRADNDIVPAADAGMLAVFIRRGPWAAIQREWPEVQHAHLAVDTLAELPEALARV